MDQPPLEPVEEQRRHPVDGGQSGRDYDTEQHRPKWTALRFLFIVTLRKPQLVIRLPFIREPRKLPIVLSAEEVTFADTGTDYLESHAGGVGARAETQRGLDAPAHWMAGLKSATALGGGLDH